MKKLFSTLSIIFLLSPLSVLALNFDGSNDFVQIQDSSIFDVGNAGSWCLWIYSNAAQSQKALFMHDVASGKTASTWLWIGAYLTTNSTILSGYVRISGVSYAASKTGAYNKTWTHVCTTFDRSLSSNRLNVYVDGVIGTPSNAADGAIDAGADPVIGQWEGNNTYFNGLIDDVRIYNRALMPNEVRMLYRGFSPRSGLIGYWPLIGNTSGTFEPDLSGYRNHGTRTGGPIRAALHPFTRLMKFR